MLVCDYVIIDLKCQGHNKIWRQQRERKFGLSSNSVGISGKRHSSLQIDEKYIGKINC